MSVSTKRIAAIAAASALGLGGAFATVDASAAPSADPTATTKPSDSTKPSGSTTPVDSKKTPAPRASTPASKPESSFGGTSTSGTPTYNLNSNTGVSTSKGWLESDGKRLANQTVTLYDYTGEKRGQQLGQATTDANGEFTLTATIPASLRSQDYNLELVYAGNDQVEGTRAVLRLPKATPTPGAPTTAAPTTKPTTPGKKPGLPSTGAEGMPVLPALASLGVLAAGAAVVLRRK